MPPTAASFLLQAAPWVSLDIRRGSVADIAIPIPSIALQKNDDPQECLLWQFQLHEYDVGFQVLENGVVVQDLGRFNAAKQDDSDPNTNAMMVPHPLQVEPMESTMEGRFDNIKPESVYTLRWDNSYSLVRHKQVRYRFLMTSNRVVAAAELAVQESQSRSQRRARRAAAGLPLPHLAKTLEKERAMSDEERKVGNERMTANLEQAVMDIVSIFIAKPDSPLHEGAVRPFILALEAVLCNGIKEEFLDVWPEAPFYEFLLKTQHVLRDDMGIVAEVQAGEPPSNLQYLGWNNSRSFLLLTLNKGILQRAFENLSKRRVVVEKFYEPKALLYKYEDARKIASFLSALNGVTFLLAAYPPDECSDEDQSQFPRNLKQCAPEAPLLGNELAFYDDVQSESSVMKFIEGDPDEIKQLDNCTVPRYILHGEPFQETVIGRSTFELLSISEVSGAPVVLAQLRVQTQDILLSVATQDGQDLTKPIRLSALDEWIELIVRFKSSPIGGLTLKLDNSYSMVRSKQVQIRYLSADTAAYVAAWEGCLEMAQSISWNHASRAGSERCAEYMASLQQKEETEVILQRKQVRGESNQDMDDGIMGFRSSLLSNPVSYIGGLLSSEGNPEACDQCLTPFSFFSRQHECPCCKKIVCIQCSRHHVQVNGKGQQLKVCDGCFIKEKEKERARIANMKGKSAGESGERPEYAALRRDPAMDKYFKMLSFGVPSSGVAQKMTQDEMTSDKIAIFVAGPEGSTASGFGRTTSTFRKVYWTNLDSDKANETIWSRINVMFFASQFQHQQQELRNRIRVITQACYEILQSERLARCFELVLAIGNLLNTGTELEGAHGITLASLLKTKVTLLQFIIKLIHNRGEGDVLLFTNDLSTLIDARRYSNVICDSQARSLQQEITKLEQEIKEDMVEDLKRFNKAEALRKHQFEERKVQRHRPVVIQSNRVPNIPQEGKSDPQNVILGAIRQRGSNTVVDFGVQTVNNGLTSNNPHVVMLSAIRSRGGAIDTKSTEENLSARISAGERGHASFEVDRDAIISSASSPHASLLNAIRSRPQNVRDETNWNEDNSVRLSEAVRASSARSSLLASIRKCEQPTFNPDSNHRSSIKQRRSRVAGNSDAGADQNGISTLSGDSQAALLAAIRQQATKPKQEMSDIGGASSSKANEKFEPRQYKMKSKFISVMRERLMNIKAAFEDIEMDLETLHSVWDGTARYLAEDSNGSSTEYVFGLLNRFLLDVKVAKTLLFRKGLSFVGDASSLLPHACK
ncbi:Leucine-rich repeat protein soc-2 [Phytophthora nicotianae]|uniref:Leucine-rich repeat protein soc-2 n=1 Tax=Phytophthora nicotianae TaxID=4792 RepID=A0A0W8DJB0_PHYNI|nr:Leucine-rich repeat protein soc-2 [Phytophthora nicotianae]